MSIGGSIASGALWMVLLNVLMSAISVVSTVVLARLLLPSDFGIIAMAMSFVAILELLWSFAFDSALIQDQTAKRATYDTAWTMNIGLGVTVAAGLLALAYPAALFYSEPRLLPLMCCLAIGSVFQGFENIGVVAFRKELRFGSEFYYQIARKLTGFLVTVPLAFALRSYWAMAIGIVAGRIANVALSYFAHPYRPKASLAAYKDLVNFSKWLFANNILYVLSIRSQDFVIGKIAGPAALGLYTLSYEISTMPATNLVQPINRAVFPGFSRMAADKHALRHGYLNVLAMIALLAVPAGLGIAAVAEPLIPLLLGERWLQAVPIVQVLAIYGVLAALSSVFGPVFMALGRPRVLTWFSLLNLSIFIPAIVIGAMAGSVRGAAWGCLFVVTIMMPLSHWLASRALGIRLRQVAAMLWRPAAAAVSMYVAVAAFLQAVSAGEGIAARVMELAAGVALGAVVYGAAVLMLWTGAGKPDGAERKVIGFVTRTNLIPMLGRRRDLPA